jgi:type II secretory pathway predicted ATPase ExeA
MLDRLDDEQYESALLVIIHSAISAEWLLRRIAAQIGIGQAAEEKVALLTQIYQRLMELHEAGRKAVVLIDEANMLQQRELMEELRGFLNLEVPGSKLITFILFGLPSLDAILALDTPLTQRVAVMPTRFMNPNEQGYIPAPAESGGATRSFGGRVTTSPWTRGGFH